MSTVDGNEPDIMFSEMCFGIRFLATNNLRGPLMGYLRLDLRKFSPKKCKVFVDASGKVRWLALVFLCVRTVQPFLLQRRKGAGAS